MAFKDPFAAYNAASNLEAHLVCGQLQDAGIDAMVIEDVSTTGLWVGGTVSELHKPQVWIERSDIDRARPILADYEKHRAEHQAGKRADTDANAPPIEVVCEECGKLSEFPASKKGMVENCPHCHAFVDVEEDDLDEDWGEAPDEENPDDEEQDA